MDGYEVGRKVVCVNDDWDKAEVKMLAAHGCIFPVKGTVYAIRGLTVRYIIKLNCDLLMLYVQEITNPVLTFLDGTYEMCFDARCFKPLDEKRLDVFRSLLVSQPKEKAIG